MSSLRLLSSLIVVVLLTSCGGRETLQRYPSLNPSTVSLAGNWLLRDDPRAMERELARAIRQTDGIRDDARIMPQGQRGNRRGSGRTNGGLAHVFFKNAEALKITQTPSAMFISFNRAIVEEYRFGEMRGIELGQAEAQRVSGWDGTDYVIETLDRQGMKVSERYDLSSDRKTLTRRITFRARNNDAVTVVQTFARVE